jgi:hypothetical protein
MAGYALDAESGLEWKLGHLGPHHARPWQELQLGAANNKASIARQSAVPKRWRPKQKEEPLWRVEIHVDVTAGNPKPFGRHLLDGVPREVEPGVIRDGDGDQPPGVVVVLRGKHGGGESDAGGDPLCSLGRGAQSTTVS